MVEDPLTSNPRAQCQLPPMDNHRLPGTQVEPELQALAAGILNTWLQFNNNWSFNFVNEPGTNGGHVVVGTMRVGQHVAFSATMRANQIKVAQSWLRWQAVNALIWINTEMKRPQQARLVSLSSSSTEYPTPATDPAQQSSGSSTGSMPPESPPPMRKETQNSSSDSEDSDTEMTMPQLQQLSAGKPKLKDNGRKNALLESPDCNCPPILGLLHVRCAACREVLNRWFAMIRRADDERFVEVIKSLRGIFGVDEWDKRVLCPATQTLARS